MTQIKMLNRLSGSSALHSTLCGPDTLRPCVTASLPFRYHKRKLNFQWRQRLNLNVVIFMQGSACKDFSLPFVFYVSKDSKQTT